MSDSLYHNLLRRNALIQVAMNDVQMLSHSQMQNAIGTHCLNGCTGIIIIGVSVILAHIAPFEDDEATFAAHHESFLNQIQALVQAHPLDFPPDCTTGIGLLAIDNIGWLWKIYAQIAGRMSALGVQMVPSFYLQRSVGEIVSPKGEVVIYRDAAAGRWQVVVERSKIWPRDELIILDQVRMWHQQGLEHQWVISSLSKMLDLDHRAATKLWERGSSHVIQA